MSSVAPSNPNSVLRQERVGRVIIGDVGTGNTATAFGDILTATKTSPVLGGISTMAVTMAAMPNTNYNVFFGYISSGIIGGDLELKPPAVIAASMTTTGFRFAIEETVSSLQNITVMIYVKAI